ncbi:uncharacterized protein [Leptinotarsa decemlineata]|uniref:uncharacterized protein n=1 Tax=Leptinotarsa decemlineata TaxID=7539 RepID=UPI003D30A018
MYRSVCVLTSDETSLLAKGENFSVTPSTIPTEKIIANIEAGIENLPADIKEELRGESARMLRKFRPPRCSIPTGENAANAAKCRLNADENITILPADKGNATMVSNTSNYKSKVNNLVSQETYKRLQKDLTEKITRKTNQLIELHYHKR